MNGQDDIENRNPPIIANDDAKADDKIIPYSIKMIDVVPPNKNNIMHIVGIRNNY